MTPDGTRPTLPRRDVPALIEVLRIRALALTGQKWELSATRDMMKEAADQLERLTAAEATRLQVEHERDTAVKAEQTLRSLWHKAAKMYAGMKAERDALIAPLAALRERLRELAETWQRRDHADYGGVFADELSAVLAEARAVDNEACHCAEPAPLAPGAKCRKCHRWTVALVNETTGTMTTIPSNQDAEARAVGEAPVHQREAFELQLREDAERLFSTLCEGEGEHTEALDVSLILAAFRHLLAWTGGPAGPPET